MHPPDGPGAPPPCCSQQHPQARALPVQQSELMAVLIHALAISRSKMPCLYFLQSHLLEVLPYDSKARRVFVTNGGLKRVQEIQAEPGSSLQEYISSINSCFSEDIVKWETSRKHTFTNFNNLEKSSFNGTSQI